MGLGKYVAVGVAAVSFVSGVVCWSNVEKCQRSLDSPKFDEVRKVQDLDAKIFPRRMGSVESAAPFLSDSELRDLEPQFVRRNDLVIANRTDLQEYSSISSSLRNYGLGTIGCTLTTVLGSLGYLCIRRNEGACSQF